MKKVTLIILAVLISLSYADDWELLTSGEMEINSNYVLGFNFIDGRYGLIATGAIRYTSDSGKTWDFGKYNNSTSILKSNGNKSICFSDVNTAWAVSSTEGIVFKSLDGGKNWEPAVTIDSSDFIRGSMGKIFFPTPVVGYFFVRAKRVATDDFHNTIVRKTADGGATWGLSQIDGFGGGGCGFFLNADTGWISAGDVYPITTDDRLRKTVDGGVTWDSLVFPASSGSINSIFFLNNDVGWIGGGAGKVSKTIDGGKTWTTYDGNQGTFSQLHFISENVGWGLLTFNSGGNSLLYTIDGGKSWELTGANPWKGGGCSLFEPLAMYFDSFNGWVVGNCGRVYRTQNYGGLQDLVSVKPVARPRHRATSLPRVSVMGRTLHISSPANTAYNIRLVDMRGRTSARFSASGSGSFSLAKLPSGRYLAEVKTAVSKTTTAIIVQR